MKKFDFNFKDIVENAKDVIIVTKSFPINEPGPEIVYVNKAFTELTGYTPEEVIGKNPRILQSSEPDQETIETKVTIKKRLKQQEPVRATIKNYSKSGREYWLDLSILPLKNSQGIVSHFVAIERDITEQKNIEQKLEVLSRTDPLTGLLNRRAFDEILENELSRFKKNSEVYSILMIDIDHFKVINDKYGHATGDIAIQTVTQSCQSNLRLQDTMARLGGEEFCVLLPYTKRKNAYDIAERIRSIISNTSITTADDAEIFLTISIGVGEVRSTDIHHTAVLKRADDNLYKAKATGRNRVCI
jgi:diguanylate cyclase (GGDEF)-like protein/PAS domain S-box-containing protein